jgi:hypothetical protein
MIFVPYAAPSTGAFVENSPPGVRQGGRTSAEGQEPLLLTLGKSEERKKQAATGSPFLWLLSFGEAKESNSPSGARTRLKINRRGSDTLIKNVNAV